MGAVREGGVLQSLLSDWEVGRWTDVVLVGEDSTRVRAHRLVLAACSPLLSSLLVEGGQEGEATLLLPSLPGWAIQLVVSSLYGDTAVDTWAPGSELLHDAACLLGLGPERFPTNPINSVSHLNSIGGDTNEEFFQEIERLSSLSSLNSLEDVPQLRDLFEDIEVPANESVDLELLECIENSIKEREKPENTLNDAVNEETEVQQKILVCDQISVPRRKLLLALFTCSQCGKVFSSLQQRETHATCAPSASCVFPECGEVFTDFTDLQQHLTKIHSQYLMKHEATHTGQRFKAVKCKFCNKTVEYCKLKNHELIHTGEKPFKCSDCDYRCIQRSNLRIHMKGVHKKDLPRLAVGQKRYSGKFMDGSPGNMDPFDMRSVVNMT